MIVEIEVQPKTAALVDQAKAKGVSFDIILRDALKEVDNESFESDTLSSEELDAQLDMLAEGSDNAPILPDAANTRAFYYEERIQ